jgi:hypothetical protein
MHRAVHSQVIDVVQHVQNAMSPPEHPYILGRQAGDAALTER